VAQEYALQTAFNGGEWTPLLTGQILLKKYRESCQILENFIVYPHGPAHTRPGFIYRAELSNSAKRGRLVPFIYSTLQSYMTVWEDSLIRFISGQALIIDPGTGLPLVVVTPYSDTDLPYLKFAQSFDVKYVVHRSYPVRKLERFSETSWAIPEASFVDGPYRDINIDGVTYLQASATTGTGVTLTATTRGVAADLGTTAGTADTPLPGFTSTLPLVGFKFTPSATCQANSASIYVANAPVSAISVPG